MKRYGSIIGLRDENIAEYRKLHAAVWSVVAGAIARACPKSGVFSNSISNAVI
jgi:L-rhamnose mutarotase